MAGNGAGGLAILSDGQDQKVSYEQRETDLNRSSEAVDTQIQNIKAQIATLIELSNKIPRKFRGKIKYELKQLQLLSIKLEHARTEEYRNITGLIALLVSWVSEVYVQYKEIFEHINVGIGLADTKQRTFIRTNGFLCDILEIERCDYSGLNYKEFWDDFVVDTEAFTKLKEQFRNDRKVNGELLQIRTWKGNLKWLRIFSVSIDGGNKEIFTVFDVTNRENERKELERMKAALEAAIAMINHQFINAIGSVINIMKEENLGDFFPSLAENDPIGKSNLMTIRDGLSSKQILFKTHIDVIKMAKGTYMPVYSHFDIVNLLRTQLPKTSSKENFIFLDGDGKELDINSSIFLDGDELYLGIAMNNLLKNAVEHPNDGSPVTIKITEKKDNIILEIHNNGLISESLKGKIYKEIVKSTKGRAGNGIGTFIIGRVIEVHGGQIDPVSIEGKGTTTTIILPKKAANTLSEEDKTAQTLLNGGVQKQD